MEKIEIHLKILGKDGKINKFKLINIDDCSEIDKIETDIFITQDNGEIKCYCGNVIGDL